MSYPVVIINHDSRWPLIYEEEKRRILDVGSHKILSLEHIGSTSVVGLGAKPIIDIMAGVNELSDADGLLPVLSAIGYKNSVRQSGDPEWYYCLSKIIYGKEAWLQNLHLHLMKFKSQTWKRHILFRDFLRNHSEVAQKYNKLKRMLAAKYGNDRESYTNAKTKFIASVSAQSKEK